VYGLRERLPGVQLEFDLPSRLATGLAQERFDVALIPSIEYFQDPTYQIVSDACIACRGPVWSVKLFSRVAPQRIRTLALDEGSRTSVALVRILLQQCCGITPETQPLPIGCGAETSPADAVLLIGDRAIHRPEGDFVAEWDLGEQWCRWARLPFVFAMWVAREGLASDELAAALQLARDEGLANLREIANQEAATVRLSSDECLSYLRDNLYFFLGPREQRGLALFREHATRLGLCPSPPDIRDATIVGPVDATTNG
jgi:chorismate dehydratase